MGKLKFVNPAQELVFSEFARQEELTSHFYFTGGTALSTFYLHHRESYDLAFFSQEDFENELVLDFMEQIAKRLKMLMRFTQRYKSRIFEFVQQDKLLVKVDFVHYPYQRIEKGKTIRNVQIDSLRDIAANKLLITNQRTEVKDYVDLYFLLKEFTLWDLIYAVEAKFKMELDLILISADFLKVEEFDVLPKMLVPLKLAELQFFLNFKRKFLLRGLPDSKKFNNRDGNQVTSIACFWALREAV